MTRKRFAVMMLVLTCAVPLAAQSRPPKANPDPISGTWAGQIVPTGDDRGRSVTLVLKHDGKGTVSGTITGLPNPGDVKAGTFDPATGALKLQLGIEGDSDVKLVLDGKVEKNVATGHVSGEVTGGFTLTKSTKP
jgi:hypothetical protein